jgi:stage III sporulation protein AG
VDALKNMKINLSGILSKQNRTKLIVLLCVGVIALIFFGSLGEKDEGNSVEINEAAAELSTAQYVSTLEQKVAELVSSIKGAGNAKVMITLQNGVEYIYAVEGKSNNDLSESVDGGTGKRSSDEKTVTEEKHIIVEGKNGKEALIRTTLPPSVGGVVIVCSGADSEVVRERIIEAVTTALGISSKRVCVTLLAN